jgi:hypothetical protein
MMTKNTLEKKKLWFEPLSAFVSAAAFNCIKMVNKAADLFKKLDRPSVNIEV